MLHYVIWVCTVRLCTHFRVSRQQWVKCNFCKFVLNYCWSSNKRRLHVPATQTHIPSPHPHPLPSPQWLAFSLLNKHKNYQQKSSKQQSSYYFVQKPLLRVTLSNQKKKCLMQMSIMNIQKLLISQSLHQHLSGSNVGTGKVLMRLHLSSFTIALLFSHTLRPLSACHIWPRNFTKAFGFYTDMKSPYCMSHLIEMK